MLDRTLPFGSALSGNAASPFGQSRAPQRESRPARGPKLESLIGRIAGLDLTDKAAVGALARQMDWDLFPEVVPDRAYRIKELEPFGFKKGRIYKASKTDGLIIRKNGRSSYILGRDLLAWIDRAPILGNAVSMEVDEKHRRR
jgi:hypothetical protein